MCVKEEDDSVLIVSVRRLLKQAHRYYIQGSLYFMANDPRVPNATRSNTQTYGYCKDE